MIGRKKIAILETGTPAAPLRARFGGYGRMFERALEQNGDFFDTTILPIFENDCLPVPADFDGYLITGSPFGVYEDHAFIAPAQEFIRTVIDQRIPIVGICFGHQLMAKAMGARVEKAAVGWGVGLHTYTLKQDQTTNLTALAAFGGAQTLSCVVSHQDQVLTLTAAMTGLGGSAFCPNGVLAYGDSPALSFQMHPEFDHDFARALLESRKDRLSSALFAQALASYNQKSDRELMITVLIDFFRQSQLVRVTG